MDFAQFPASLRPQTGRQEIVQEIGEMMHERLKLWEKTNKQLPSRIILYRDGVSESQYQEVIAEEFKNIKLAYRMLYTDKQWPQTAIIVVGKRHHTRFIPTESTPAKCKTANGNPKNGTVVDRGITMDRGWDFFLQAHDSLQGTARPAHYVVLLNEFGDDMDANKLEKLVSLSRNIGGPRVSSYQSYIDTDPCFVQTHNLCYIYGRATKAVSICPPAYYADLACERGRCYLQWHCNINEGESGRVYKQENAPWHRDVNRVLRNTMFYI